MKRWEKDGKGELVSMVSLDAPDAAGLQICATKGCQVQWLRVQKGLEDTGRAR